jgi:hypothetical protein
MTRMIPMTMIILAAISASACTPKLSAQQKEHKGKIESLLLLSKRGWLIEAADGKIYKVFHNTRSRGDVARMGMHDSSLNVVYETIGTGNCYRCAGYYSKVVPPEDPEYPAMAVKFMGQ